MILVVHLEKKKKSKTLFVCPVFPKAQLKAFLLVGMTDALNIASQGWVFTHLTLAISRVLLPLFQTTTVFNVSVTHAIGQTEHFCFITE